MPSCPMHLSVQNTGSHDLLFGWTHWAEWLPSLTGPVIEIMSSSAAGVILQHCWLLQLKQKRLDSGGLIVDKTNGLVITVNICNLNNKKNISLHAALS